MSTVQARYSLVFLRGSGGLCHAAYALGMMPLCTDGNTMPGHLFSSSYFCANGPLPQAEFGISKGV